VAPVPIPRLDFPVKSTPSCRPRAGVVTLLPVNVDPMPDFWVFVEDWQPKRLPGSLAERATSRDIPSLTSSDCARSIDSRDALRAR